jgi:hypothetical protein
MACIFRVIVNEEMDTLHPRLRLRIYKLKTQKQCHTSSPPLASSSLPSSSSVSSFFEGAFYAATTSVGT